MFAHLRAGILAAAVTACVAVAAFSASAADKPFKNDDLANSAIELEAQIKSDAGVATKPVDQLRRDLPGIWALILRYDPFRAAP